MSSPENASHNLNTLSIGIVSEDGDVSSHKYETVSSLEIGTLDSIIESSENRVHAQSVIDESDQVLVVQEKKELVEKVNTKDTNENKDCMWRTVCEQFWYCCVA